MLQLHSSTRDTLEQNYIKVAGAEVCGMQTRVVYDLSDPHSFKKLFLTAPKL